MSEKPAVTISFDVEMDENCFDCGKAMAFVRLTIHDTVIKSVCKKHLRIELERMGIIEGESK